jgi:hypothetical protein
MRILSKFMATAVFAAGVTLAAAPAHALVLAPVGPGASTATFFHPGLGVAGSSSFFDTFTFTLANPGIVSGTLSSPFNQNSIKTCNKKHVCTTQTFTQNLAFITVKLSLSGSSFATWTFTTNGAGVSALGGMGLTSISPGTHTLTVSGSNLGNTISNYTGVLNFLPVPEPATWAMMIVGFGMLGLAGRRRRQLSAALV